jgi:hypothetical protein
MSAGAARGTPFVLVDLEEILKLKKKCVINRVKSVDIFGKVS